jgi:sucrose phosphorylase
VKNQVQLITYVDRLAGSKGLSGLKPILDVKLRNVFGGVHLLPFFHPIDGSDAGFDPINHTSIDSRLGDWDHLRELGQDYELMADLIVNHMSSQSPQFEDWSTRGSDSPYAGLFLTYQRVFPNGATQDQLLNIYRPRPGLPFTKVTLGNGEQHFLWTTFTPTQVDIDVAHPEGKKYLTSILQKFASAGVKVIRLDAAGYAIKKAGTSCFMIPETFAFIAELAAEARALKIETLVEIHSHYLQQIEIAKRVDRVYDFALPPLVLHALFTGQARHLCDWLTISPRNAITVLDTHDGIGVIDAGADAEGRPGLLPPAELDKLVETIHQRSNGESRQATGAAASNLDLYQVNCTYYNALGARDLEYLIARAIQFFAPGVPQVYYTGLLCGSNDMELLQRSKVGRDINRHYYTAEEIDQALERPVVRELIELIQFRNSHPAFNGTFSVHAPAPHRLTMTWRKNGDLTQLDVDLKTPSATITNNNTQFTIGSRL